MSQELILVGAVAMAALSYIIWPLFLPIEIIAAGEKENKTDMILDEIEDLDLEHAAGKIPDEAYKKIRTELVADAASILADNKNIK